MEKYRQNAYIFKHFSVNRFLCNKFNDLLLADTFRAFSISMVSLFVPIFLYELGFAIIAIILFELLILTASILSHFVVLKNIHAWKVKRSLVISNLLLILFYLCLYSSDILIFYTNETTFLVIIGLITLCANTLYWSARHIYFIASTTIRKSGAQYGKLIAVPTLVTITGPFLGGLLITQFGFKFAFLFCIIFMAAASVALFFSQNIKIKKARLKIKSILDRDAVQKNSVYFIQGMAYVATGTLWPLFMFLASIKILTIGFFYLLSKIVFSLNSYISGKRMDRTGNLGLAKLGIAGHGLTVIMRPLINNAFYIGFWQTLGGLTGAWLDISLDGGFYKNSHKDAGNAIMNRELYMHLGRMLTLIILLFFFSVLAVLPAFIATLIMAGLAEMLAGIIIKRDKKLIN